MYLDVKVGLEGESLVGVLNWNNEVLEWDEFMWCIWSSELGDMIVRWLNCLELLEKFIVFDFVVLSFIGLSLKIVSSYVDVNDFF